MPHADNKVLLSCVVSTIYVNLDFQDMFSIICPVYSWFVAFAVALSTLL